MTWSLTADPAAFRSAAGAFLTSRPDLHTMLLTGLDSLAHPQRSGGAAPAGVLGWWRATDRAPTTAAFVWTPPGLMAVSPLPGPAATDLARLLSTWERTPAGLLTDVTSAKSFAGDWESLTGAVPETGVHLRLHRLEGPAPLEAPAPGAPRRATAHERALLHDWCTRFVSEAGSLGVDLDRFIDERIDRDGWRLWIVDAEPVAVAAMSPVVDGMARLTPVYVPPEHRRRGYGAAVTASVSQAARAAGARHVLLFTDLSNPTSNSLYQRIGYRPVSDFRMLTP